ncbi:DUF4062 domain-containing protein [Flammeovirga sp. EKP202]|uniref:DUF4062 domain-containing protein n=1 Tax=Flammeovirga sp. EKP202 TaxID=2770592 RepID=UPI00165F97F9|nr:DUF4062 domain-containing protein [Flammeovirga sp. EKP202]MBD0404938.1 DUF4062 domain-containing protein [Flammeovirga sp. EKP202]
MNKLNVFVSSTCYDLSQIRVDIRDFILDIGYNPVLSEFENFPINPSNRTIDNCIDAVKNNADIFVLVVGNRYGSLIETGRSITNTEFLTAKKKGIPIYVFIDRKMLNILPVWQKNKSGDFSSFVDTTKIFEFISDVRDNSKLWTFEFDTAQNIVSVLKTQFSYLFKDSLLLKNKFHSEIEELYRLNISNEALNLILDKPESYEIRFFIQTMKDEISKKESLKNDYEYSIILNSKFAIYDNQDLVNWVQQRLAVLGNLIESLNRLIHDAYPKFYAEPGTPSDLKGLFYTSETYARIYENIIQWTIETASTCVNEEYLELRNKLAKLSDQAINEIWKYPFENSEKINKALNMYESNNSSNKLTLELKIGIDNQALDDYNKEFENLKNILNN